jgi:biotin carboxyl carrier protein
MTFEVEIAGRTRTVVIERADRAGRFRVTLDGVSHILDVAREGQYGLSLLVSVPDGAGAVPFSRTQSPEKMTLARAAGALRSADLQIAPGATAGELLVNLDGRTASVILNGRRTGRPADTAGPGLGDVVITAPMPGRVVRVLVAAGEQVGARQGIVVVEAMKMENELRAPRAGRVKEIRVSAGAPVEAGRILAVIE